MAIASVLSFAVLSFTVSSAGRGRAGSVDPFVGHRARAPDYGTGVGAGATFPGAPLPYAIDHGHR